MTFTISKSKSGKSYSITGPDGNGGDWFDFGFPAIYIDDDGEVFYANMQSPSDTPKVYRVVDVEQLRTKLVQEDSDPEDGDADDHAGTDDSQVIVTQ